MKKIVAAPNDNDINTNNNSINKHLIYESNNSITIKKWWTPDRLSILQKEAGGPSSSTGTSTNSTNSTTATAATTSQFWNLLMKHKKMSCLAYSDGTYDPILLTVIVVGTMPVSTLNKHVQKVKEARECYERQIQMQQQQNQQPLVEEQGQQVLEKEHNGTISTSTSTSTSTNTNTTTNPTTTTTINNSRIPTLKNIPIVIQKNHQIILRKYLLFLFSKKYEKLMMSFSNGLTDHFNSVKLWTKVTNGGMYYKSNGCDNDDGGNGGGDGNGNGSGSGGKKKNKKNVKKRKKSKVEEDQDKVNIDNNNDSNEDDDDNNVNNNDPN